VAVTRQIVSNVAKECIRMLGDDDQHFSGMSMRRGGLSMAINARVPEPILYLQKRSRKGQGGAGRAGRPRRYRESNFGGLRPWYILDDKVDYKSTKSAHAGRGGDCL
jgi:hypothetical protein